MELVERGAVLTELDGALDAAVTGRGSLTFLAGEAGIGKTSVVTTFVERHRSDAAILVGACDNLSAPRPLGPLHDMAATSRDVGSLFERESRHQLFVGLLEQLSTPGRPAIVALEDVHWADAATLDLLRFLGRRIGRSHAAVLATYRSDEVSAAHPLRVVLGDLATIPAVSRQSLAPLSLDAVTELAADTEVDPVELHRRTGGNPFFVTEVLAHPDAELPDNVRDAVLARYGRLNDGARQVLDVASIVPGSIDRDLLAAVADPTPEDIDACVSSGVLRIGDRGQLVFRHELARLAVESAVLPARRAELHGEVMRALLDRDDPDPARIAHHADAAGDADAVIRYATEAADRAWGRGAVKQARDQFARAVRYADHLPDPRRADLLLSFSQAAGLAGEAREALDAGEAAVRLFRGAADPMGLGVALNELSSARWQAGDGPGAHDALEEALQLLRPLGETPELVATLARAATLAMLARHYDRALELGRHAIDLAQEMDQPRSLARALNSVGAVEILIGDWASGERGLLRSIEVARDAGLEDLVVVGWSNLGSGFGEVRNYDAAARYLEEAIAFASARDLDPSAHYSTSWLARVRFETGRWEDAARLATSLPLEHPGLSPITTITALAVLGHLRSRRGDDGVGEALDRAWELAVATNDLQRLWPVAAARAEDAWLDDREEAIPDLVSDTYRRAVDLGHPWAIGELGALLWRGDGLEGDERRSFEKGGAEPYVLQVAGDIEAAAAAWAEIGCPYEQADALAGGDEDEQREALQLFDELGAGRAAARLRRRMRAAGIRSIPRGPRPATADHPAGLTPREAEVLELVADGLTNAEIGGALFISEKTAEHHVSSILGKLGVSSRHEAVEAVEALGGEL